MTPKFATNIKERDDVKFPMWRKKIDSTIFESGTPIPQWVAKMWDLEQVD
jgi:hypothetical protein